MEQYSNPIAIKRDNIYKKYEEELNKLSCAHTNWSWTKRQIKGGSFQYGKQCKDCGRFRIMKKAVVCENDLAIYSSTRMDNHLKRISKIHKLREAEFKVVRDEFFVDHNEYLKSPEWYRKRELVLKRENGICQGCGFDGATHVHHTSYDNHKNEFLFELMALCKGCHERVHGRKL